MALLASPAFAVSGVPVVVSAGAFVVAVGASVPAAGVVAAVCAESPAASGHQRRAVVVFAVLADVSARCAASPGIAAGAADQAVAGASAPTQD